MGLHASLPQNVAGLVIGTLLLTACTTGGDGSANMVERMLGLTGATSPTNAVAAADPLAQSATPTAFAANAAPVHFTPIVGAPIDKVAVFSQHLSVIGPKASIRLVPAGTAGAEHEIRGYFSALSENGQTTVIHVWDVFTPNGQRVHRIQGQQQVPGAAGDPWAAVPDTVMERIADHVVSEYAIWRNARA